MSFITLEDAMSDDEEKRPPTTGNVRKTPIILVLVTGILLKAVSIYSGNIHFLSNLSELSIAASLYLLLIVVFFEANVEYHKLKNNRKGKVDAGAGTEAGIKIAEDTVLDAVGLKTDAEIQEYDFCDSISPYQEETSYDLIEIQKRSTQGCESAELKGSADKVDILFSLFYLLLVAAIAILLVVRMAAALPLTGGNSLTVIAGDTGIIIGTSSNTGSIIRAGSNVLNSTATDVGGRTGVNIGTGANAVSGSAAFALLLAVPCIFVLYIKMRKENGMQPGDKTSEDILRIITVVFLFSVVVYIVNSVLKINIIIILPWAAFAAACKPDWPRRGCSR